ncbi:hypothetical protein BC940DRAFT_311058 [Gongronella butleri]|nr:hypothetical protein BC940DRAFT_311058 [Gongronella butleri]
MDQATTMNLVWAHAAMMAYTWLLAVPLAIGLAMYGRAYEKSWWAKAHMMIMGFGVLLPLTVATGCAFAASDTTKSITHSVFGTIIVFGAWLQILLGLVNHVIFKRRQARNALPAAKPWHNSIHIWLGRVLPLLALVNIPLGMSIRNPAQAWYIGYGIWVGMLFVLLVALLWNSRRLRKLKIESPSTLAAETKSSAKQEVQEIEKD